MKTPFTVLLLSSLVLAAVPALAEEGDPETREDRADCEDWVDNREGPSNNPNYQPWIGYGSTDGLREYWYEEHDPDRQFNNCEGEHWDGQDNVQDGRNPDHDVGECHAEIAPASAGWAQDFYWANCVNDDINDADDDNLGSRVSLKNHEDSVEVYVGLDVYVVGRVAVYQGYCEEGSEGLEGDETCEETISRSAVYLRDDTPDNQLAKVISSVGLTRGNVGEEDCDQKTYQKGAYDNTRGCTRDNTAITIELMP